MKGERGLTWKLRWTRCGLAVVVCALSGGCIRPLTVARERTVPFNDFDAMQILSGMTAVLGNSDGPADFACAGDFANVLSRAQLAALSPDERAQLEQEVARRGGRLDDPAQPLVFLLEGGGVPDFQGARDIMTETDLREVLSKPAYVKVVGSIHRCAGGGPAPMTSIVGCGATGSFNSFVVKDVDDGNGGPNNGLAAMIWAHEYGHTVGLRDLSGQPTRVMNGTLTGSNRELTQAECEAYTLPVDGDGPDGSLLDPSVPLLPAQAEVVRRPAGMPIETFARQLYFHGLTYAVRQDLLPSDVEPLLRMLEDPAAAPYRENVLAMLGMVGDERVGVALVDHVERMRLGTLPVKRSDELTSALLGLGVLANQNQSTAVLDRLLAWSEPSSWTPEDAELGRHIQVTAMMALALTGMPPARDRLAQRNAADADARMQRNLDEIAAMAQDVATRGLAAHMLGR